MKNFKSITLALLACLAVASTTRVTAGGEQDAALTREPDICSICLESPPIDAVQPLCGSHEPHWLCQACARTLIERAEDGVAHCPICRGLFHDTVPPIAATAPQMPAPSLLRVHIPSGSVQAIRFDPPQMDVAWRAIVDAGEEQERELMYPPRPNPPADVRRPEAQRFGEALGYQLPRNLQEVGPHAVRYDELMSLGRLAEARAIEHLAAQEDQRWRERHPFPGGREAGMRPMPVAHVPVPQRLDVPAMEESGRRIGRYIDLRRQGRVAEAEEYWNRWEQDEARDRRALAESRRRMVHDSHLVAQGRIDEAQEHRRRCEQHPLPGVREVFPPIADQPARVQEARRPAAEPMPAVPRSPDEVLEGILIDYHHALRASGGERYREDCLRQMRAILMRRDGYRPSDKLVMWAISLRLPAMLELLLQHGGNPNAAQPGWGMGGERAPGGVWICPGATALHAVFDQWPPDEHDESLVRLLLRHGADPNGRSSDEHGSTPLYHCIRRNNIVRLLLDAGADPTIGRLDNGESALAQLERNIREISHDEELIETRRLFLAHRRPAARARRAVGGFFGRLVGNR